MKRFGGTKTLAKTSYFWGVKYLRQQCSEHNPHLKHGDVHVAAVTPLQGFKQLSPMEIIENKTKSTKIDVFMIILAS